MYNDDRNKTENVEKTYRDLLEQLMTHVWALLLYVVGCLAGSYAIGRGPSVALIFFMFQVPTLVAVTYVVSANERLRFSVPWTWCLSGAIAWGWWTANSGLFAAALIVLMAYWLGRAAIGSHEEYSRITEWGIAESKNLLGNVIAWLFTFWGATLQISFIFLAATKGWVSDFLSESPIGTFLLDSVTLIRFTSPLHWIPAFAFVFGLTVLAAIRFTESPYQPQSLSGASDFARRPVLERILLPIRLPVWLLAIILGFIAHFAKLLWSSFRLFLDAWLGRLALIIVGLLTPMATMTYGHLLFLVSTYDVESHLSMAPAPFVVNVARFLSVHFFMLLSLCLYALATGFQTLRIFSISAKEAISEIRKEIGEGGIAAVNAVGKTFALYGILSFAIPLSALLPSGASWGFFSSTYSVVLGAVLGWRAFRTKKAAM